jgi:membrane-associated phospholipid phosphatase
MPESVLEWGVTLILALQGLGDWLIAPMNVITFLGNTEFYLLVMPALYWCWDSRLGLRVGIDLLLSAVLNSVLKMSMHDPRPYWFDPRVRLLSSPGTSFGIPSGHSQNAAVIWGVVGAYLRRGWGWTVAVALIFLIGLSRIYLGEHFPTDVFAGWAIGIIALVLFLRLESTVSVWVGGLSKAKQVLISFVISLIILLVGVLVSSSVNAVWQLPGEWLRNAAEKHPDTPLNPLSIDDVVLSAGVFFGLAGGAALFQRGFDAGGHWAKRLGRYLVGALGVLVLWRGVSALFSLLADEGTFLGHALRYVRYGLIGAWVSALGPLVFVRLRLAEGRRED